MQRFLAILCLLVAATSGTVNARVTAGGAPIASGVPAGFSELTDPREAVVDVYFGGRRIGEARIAVRPGYVRFREPQQLLALVPNVIASPAISAAASTELPANAARICRRGTSNCGDLAPRVLGIIYDEDSFRVDVFINPIWLRPIDFGNDEYLAEPTAPLSLTTSMGIAVSGSATTSPAFHLQNRTILALRNVRFRSDTAFASKVGPVLDNFVAELDRPNVRYLAGLFWAPGLDLTGHRRILGAGIGSQFDTRADRDQLSGTPLILFLPRPAHVDVLIDGRIAGSGFYEAGNNIIDTAGMPDGSYSLVLRIRERNGAIRTERRFFAKTPKIAPAGKPMYFGYAGVLANTRGGRAISLSSDLLYQFGTAHRLHDALAVDASVIGTSKKPMLEIGSWLITSAARIRAAGLVSGSGDRAALLQIAAGGNGALTLNFDLRAVRSRDGKSLLPISNYVDRFEAVPLKPEHLAEGSYTQASGSIGVRLGAAYLSAVGSVRHDEGGQADYSIGPNVNWPLVNRNGLQIILQADAQRTQTGSAGYAGVRLMYSSRGYSLSNAVGHRAFSSRGDSGSSRARAVVSTGAHYSHRTGDEAEFSLGAGLERDISSATARVGANLLNSLGSVRGEVLHQFEGNPTTHYVVALRSGLLVNGSGAVIAGRNLQQSALMVSVGGAPAEADFEVLVDEQPKGRLKSGSQLPIFLEPYRGYDVRIRPLRVTSVSFDTAPRKVVLYPGNVQHVKWETAPLVTVFGRAIRPDGSSVADALVTAARGIGQSNSEGYFQVDVAGRESLSFAVGMKEKCTVDVGKLEVEDDFAALGTVVCQ